MMPYHQGIAKQAKDKKMHKARDLQQMKQTSQYTAIATRRYDWQKTKVTVTLYLYNYSASRKK